MNAKHILFSSVISLAAAGAMADDITIDNTSPDFTASRAQVKADVLKARKAGELLGAGEAGQIVRAPSKSTTARSDVVAQFQTARARGELLAAGEGSSNDDKLTPREFTLARADVKAEVVAARNAGELLPAGEGNFGAPGHHQVASSGNPLHSVAKLFRTDGVAAPQ